jgi:hypothetical protein
MHQLANDELKQDNCAAVLTLYRLLSYYTVFYIYFTILNVYPC